MNQRELRDFLKSMRHTDIEEMWYQSEGNSIYLKKTDVESVSLPPPIDNSIAEDKSKQEEKQTIVAIKSPMVGTFSDSPSDCKFPFVKKGDIVTVGQKIGQIEAMKIIKDIFSNVKGEIVKVFTSNGQPVEYGQDLFLVDTSKEK